MLDRAAEPVRIGEIAARLEVVPRSATTLIDSLETTKLVKRSVRVGLTADGAALMRRVSSMRRESAAALFRRLTSAQREQLLELLTVLTERDQPMAGAEPALEELP
jgi:DNA-binding MarR family transcriptional regulator